MSVSTKKWNCARCTFAQSAYNDECEICGEKNRSVIRSPSVDEDVIMKDNPQSSAYGRVIYQIDRFTEDQLAATYTLYATNSTIITSKWPVYLFGDNDIDNARPPKTEREMIGGTAGVTGKYDTSIAFGIITSYYAYKPVPNYTQFVNIMNKQFDELWNKYVINGHNLIVPSPNTTDLKRHFMAYHEDITENDDDPKYEQMIFHNIGTGIAKLPLLYLKYIQYKIDLVAKLSAQHNDDLLPIICDNKEEHKLNKDEDKEEKQLDLCPNDVIEVCVNPAVDVWVDAIFLGYMDNVLRNECFVEVVRQKEDNHFLSNMDTKCIRFKQNDAFEQNEEKNNEEDEWQNVSDFVLKEYIRDVYDEIACDLLNSLDEFMRRMQFLGVNSCKSRSRALNILEAMKNEAQSLELAQKLESENKQQTTDIEYARKLSQRDDDAFIAAEIAQRLADGHTLESFECLRCSTKQEFGGIELRNCNHKICYKCFPQLISSHIQMKMLPSCLSCGSVIHQTDIKIHVNPHTAEIVSDLQIKEMMAKQKNLHQCYDKQCNGCCIIEDKYMKEFRCPVCNKRNCIKCKKIHNGTEQCYVAPPVILPQHKYHGNKKQQNHGNYHISNEEFISNWVNVKDIKYSKMIEAFDVALDSDEWKKIVIHIRDPQRRKIAKIQRIQNAKVWRKYFAYCQEMKQQQRNIDVKIGGFWHGTRTHKPEVIWKNSGFLKSKSRIGKCIWFATENTYSMNGFQHVVSADEHQVFLAFVCCGDTKQVKFIRSNKILNVYHDAATYPAYLVTYKNV